MDSELFLKVKPTGFADGWVWVGEKERSQGGVQGLGLEPEAARGALQRDRAYIALLVVFFPWFFFQPKDSEVWGFLGPSLMVRESTDGI